MTRENLVPCSTRLDKDTIERIDEFLIKHPYWKRNRAINQILWVVMHDFDDDAIYDMVRRNRRANDPISAHYEIIK